MGKGNAPLQPDQLAMIRQLNTMGTSTFNAQDPVRQQIGGMLRDQFLQNNPFSYNNVSLGPFGGFNPFGASPNNPPLNPPPPPPNNVPPPPPNNVPPPPPNNGWKSNPIDFGDVTKLPGYNPNDPSTWGDLSKYITVDPNADPNKAPPPPKHALGIESVDPNLDATNGTSPPPGGTDWSKTFVGASPPQYPTYGPPPQGTGPGQLPGFGALAGMYAQPANLIGQGPATFDPSQYGTIGSLNAANPAGTFDPSQYGTIGRLNAANPAGTFNPNDNGLNAAIQNRIMGDLNQTGGFNDDLFQQAAARIAAPINEQYAASGGFGNAQRGTQVASAITPLALESARLAQNANNARLQNAMGFSGLQYGQGANTFGLNQGAQNQAFNQAMGQFGANLGAQGQQYGQGLSAFGANQGAQNQAFNQMAQQYGLNLQGQGQRYGQGATAFGLNQGALQNNIQNAMQLAQNTQGLQGQLFGQGQQVYNQNRSDYLQNIALQESLNANRRAQNMAPLNYAMQFLGLGNGAQDVNQGLVGLQNLAGQQIGQQNAWMNMLGGLGGAGGYALGMGLRR